MAGFLLPLLNTLPDAAKGGAMDGSRATPNVCEALYLYAVDKGANRISRNQSGPPGVILDAWRSNGIYWKVDKKILLFIAVDAKKNLFYFKRFNVSRRFTSGYRYQRVRPFQGASRGLALEICGGCHNNGS